MTVIYTPANLRTFTAGELRQFPQNAWWLEDAPNEATVTIDGVNVDANRFCYHIRWVGGLANGCREITSALQSTTGQFLPNSTVVFPGVLEDASRLHVESPWRLDRPRIWLVAGGVGVLAVLGWWLMKHRRRA